MICAIPHNIGLGATRDPALVQNIGRAVAEEVTGAGIDWNFAPCLCVARNDRWGRTYESFGEKPELASSMATIVTGLQGTGPGGPGLGGSGSVLATAKHYLGDGATTGGTDQGNAAVSEAELRAIHLPPFQAAIARGVGSVMISYSSWNGAKLHGNQFLITTVLKGELGFTGFVVSDWTGSTRSTGPPACPPPMCATAVNAGIDMVMVPTGLAELHQSAAHRGTGRSGDDGPHRRRQPAHPPTEVRTRPVRTPPGRPLLHAPRWAVPPHRALGPPGGAPSPRWC